MIDLTLLHRARVIADEGSFASAAKSLGVSQPTLSRQIQALEAALGIRLFDRGRHGAIPTPLGHQILARATGVLRGADLLLHEIDLLHGLEIGDLKVGAGVYPAMLSLGTALGRLVARHPGLRVAVHVRDWRGLAQEVREAKLDLAVVDLGEGIGHPDLTIEPLPEHLGAFICRRGHPLLRRAAPTIAEVFAYPFAGTRLAPRVAAFLRGIESAGQIDAVTGEYVPSIEVNTIRMAAAAVAASDAFGIVPLLTGAELVQGGQLELLPLRPPWLKTRYGFITLRDRTLAPATIAFMEEVKGVEAELAAEETKLLGAPTPRKRGRKS
ncbi:MAG TPA: LysR family transcriptional regulator [Gemmatimonadales bacterium]|nr:LysR family transcriptional regulator [Gemmatimonadales bacterium]